VSLDPANLSKAQRFLAALLTPFQALEDAFQQLRTERSIDNAVGAQLDAIGKIVGRARQGVTDDEIYRRYVRAQIVTNKSDGLIDDMLTLADLIVFDDDATYVLDNQGACAFVLRVEGIVLDDDIADVLIAFLRRAAAAGVRPILEWHAADPSTAGRWTTQGTWGSAVWAAGTD